MIDDSDSSLDENQSVEAPIPKGAADHRRRDTAIKAMALLVIFVFGVGGGYLIGALTMHGDKSAVGSRSQTQALMLMKEINPPEGYTIPAVFGSIGPQLVVAGAINLDTFVSLYKQQNKPISNDLLDILTKEVHTQITITPRNAYFLLIYFWALGLTNQNAILDQGPMMSGGVSKVGGFASTGGWTLGAKQATTLYSSTKIVRLTSEQQSQLEEVAAAVYRPCCDNPTFFPDCNHGMAMLGLLELMASQNATVEDMYKTAKYVNAFWYPQQMLEIATAIQVTTQRDFNQADAKTVVSYNFSSISGFQSVHQWLLKNGLLEQAPSGGGSCGVQ